MNKTKGGSKNKKLIYFILFEDGCGGPLDAKGGRVVAKLGNTEKERRTATAKVRYSLPVFFPLVLHGVVERKQKRK